MTNANSMLELKRRYRRARRDILHLLDWLESELGRIEEKPQNWEPLTDRHHWILEQLREGVKLTRGMVQEKFGIGVRQAKRILVALTRRKLIDFVRKPRPGHYILCTKAIRPSFRQTVELPGDAAPPGQKVRPTARDDHPGGVTTAVTFGVASGVMQPQGTANVTLTDRQK